ncbi:MAG: glycosyltransferase family 4 protein [Simkaniaceae bacterium]|nr:glycosyltransferase family 4 protein [Simkaniaceae bacterium]
MNIYDRKVFHPFPINKGELFEEFNLDIPSDAFIVSFAGKLSKTKGIDTILMANKLLPESANIHFLILGAGDLKEGLENVDLNEISEHHVHYIGHRTPQNVARFHNAADITIMPSRTEGFGISCLEAMGCGLPAIVTCSGGPEHFAVGEIIEKENPQMLADAISKLKNLPQDEYKALSKKALEKAYLYSWRTIAKKRLNYYEQALDPSTLY